MAQIDEPAHSRSLATMPCRGARRRRYRATRYLKAAQPRLPKIEDCIANFIFDLRHPERPRGKRLPPFKSASPKDKQLIEQWRDIRDNHVRPWLETEAREMEFQAEKAREVIAE